MEEEEKKVASAGELGVGEEGREEKMMRESVDREPGEASFFL